MNNAVRRRARKAAAHIPGNAGRRHPYGNRALRRSPEGKEQIALYLDKMAQAEKRAEAA